MAVELTLDRSSSRSDFNQTKWLGQIGERDIVVTIPTALLSQLQQQHSASSETSVVNSTPIEFIEAAARRAIERGGFRFEIALIDLDFA